jgi:hypothetical protein
VLIMSEDSTNYFKYFVSSLRHIKYLKCLIITQRTFAAIIFLKSAYPVTHIVFTKYAHPQSFMKFCMISMTDSTENVAVVSMGDVGSSAKVASTGRLHVGPLSLERR